jgi:schlafen family protein
LGHKEANVLLPLIVAAEAAQLPRRASAVHRAVLRAHSMRVVRESDGMVALKRERWTEAEVDALPAREHDYFERKGGRLYGQRHFDEHVAKALSAFANSGGGHLVLGVQDDGVPDGMPLTHGGASMRDWIEQKVPPLLDHELHDFRVHQVVPSATSRIPVSSAVFVVDIGDSALAPHQSRVDHVHYHRQGGRSVPASSFYLELLRQRLTAPSLEFQLASARPLQGARREPGPLVVLLLSFLVRNEGRVAAYKWRMRMTTADGLPSGRIEDVYPEPPAFPQEVSQGGVAIGDITILPGDSIACEKKIAIQLRPNPATGSGIYDECALWLGATFGFRIATEVSPGEDRPVVLGEKLAPDVLRAYLVNNRLVT